MSTATILGSLVPNAGAIEKRKVAKLKLYMGAFEQAARVFGQVELYYNGCSPAMQKALYLRNMIDDAYHFGQAVGSLSSYTDLEARVYDLEKDDFRAKPHENSIPYSTENTHMSHLYLQARYNRNWFVRSPIPSDLSSMYDLLSQSAVDNGLMVKTAVNPGFTEDTVKKFFIEPALGWNLSTVCATWIRFQEKFLHAPLSEMIWLTMLPILVAKSGMAPYPALSIASCFSFHTYIHRASFEEKMVYLAGVLLRSAKRSRKMFTAGGQKVMDWESIMRSSGVKAGAVFDVLPWLTVRKRFRTVDVMGYCGCTRATASRVVDTLIKHNIIGYDIVGERNRIYHTQNVYDL